MKARLEEKKKAIELRKKGLSYKEIQAQVNVSKGTMSGWFKFLDLTPDELRYLTSRIKERQDRGRITSTISNRNRRIAREVVVIEDAKRLFELYKGQSMFLVGISLYWAEGSKRTGEFQFINSDPDMIMFMSRWIKKYLGVTEDEIKKRLFIHRIPGYENIDLFWSSLLGITPNDFEKTIYKPTLYGTKKNPNYKGCLRLSIGKIYFLRLMKAWQKLLIQYYVNNSDIG